MKQGQRYILSESSLSQANFVVSSRKAAMYSNDIMLWREVLKNAYRAAENGEVPVGAIVVDNEKNKIISKGWNQVNLLQDPTAHAEMLAITAATAANQTRHLSSYTVMVSLEPCIMCAGAIHWAQVKRVQYLLPDDKFGAISHHTIKHTRKDHWECIVDRPGGA